MVVRDTCDGFVPQPPSVGLQSPAQVDVLRHLHRLVESAARFERVTTHEQSSARHVGDGAAGDHRGLASTQVQRRARVLVPGERTVVRIERDDARGDERNRGITEVSEARFEPPEAGYDIRVEECHEFRC